MLGISISVLYSSNWALLTFTLPPTTMLPVLELFVLFSASNGVGTGTEGGDAFVGDEFPLSLLSSVALDPPSSLAGDEVTAGASLEVAATVAVGSAGGLIF